MRRPIFSFAAARATTETALLKVAYRSTFVADRLNTYKCIVYFVDSSWLPAIDDVICKIFHHPTINTTLGCRFVGKSKVYSYVVRKRWKLDTTAVLVPAMEQSSTVRGMNNSVCRVFVSAARPGPLPSLLVCPLPSSSFSRGVFCPSCQRTTVINLAKTNANTKYSTKYHIW